MDKTVYKNAGYESRKEYLRELSEEYGERVYFVAELLGPEEDFDGLVTMLEDSETEF